MSAFIAFLMAHAAFLSTLAALVISEVLPFTKGPTNGLLQGLLSLLKKTPAATLHIVPALLIASSLALSSCAMTSPSLKAYGAAFGSCMEAKGLQVAPDVGIKTFDILDAPGASQESITSNLEALLSSTGIGALKDAVQCAISSWLSAHPIAANAKPTPAQAAARVMSARMAARK